MSESPASPTVVIDVCTHDKLWNVAGGEYPAECTVQMEKLFADLRAFFKILHTLSINETTMYIIF